MNFTWIPGPDVICLTIVWSDLNLYSSHNWNQIESPRWNFPQALILQILHMKLYSVTTAPVLMLKKFCVLSCTRRSNNCRTVSTFVLWMWLGLWAPKLSVIPCCCVENVTLLKAWRGRTWHSCILAIQGTVFVNLFVDYLRACWCRILELTDTVKHLRSQKSEKDASLDTMQISLDRMVRSWEW